MTQLPQLTRALTETLADRVTDVRLVRGHELHCSIQAPAVPGLAALLRTEFGAELVFMAATDRRGNGGALRGPLSLRARAGRTGSSTPPPPCPRRRPSSPRWPRSTIPASRFEREIYDLFGIVAEGHPDPRPLVRHAFWPADFFPLRKDAVPRDFTDDGQPLPLRRGGRRGSVRDPGGSGARRRDRAGTLPLQRGGRDDHRHEVAPVLHPQGHREALRGSAARRGRGAGRARVWRHHRGPRPGLLPGPGGRGRHRGAGPGALSPRGAPRDGAALQSRGRLRHDRQRHRLSRSPTPIASGSASASSG